MESGSILKSIGSAEAAQLASELRKAQTSGSDERALSSIVSNRLRVKKLVAREVLESYLRGNRDGAMAPLHPKSISEEQTGDNLYRAAFQQGFEGILEFAEREEYQALTRQRADDRSRARLWRIIGIASFVLGLITALLQLFLR